MSPPKDFSAWLRFEREQRGWTLVEMAEVAGAHWNTVARWERGELRASGLAQRAVRAALREYDEKRGKRK